MIKLSRVWLGVVKLLNEKFGIITILHDLIDHLLSIVYMIILELHFKYMKIKMPATAKTPQSTAPSPTNASEKVHSKCSSLSVIGQSL